MIGVKTSVPPGPSIESARNCTVVPFCIRSVKIEAATVDIIVKLNVIVPIGVPVELNVNAFDVGVKAGVLVKPPILVTVACDAAQSWLNIKLNELAGGDCLALSTTIRVFAVMVP
jgi:hypothetical protein